MNRISCYINSVLCHGLIGYVSCYALSYVKSKLARISKIAAYLFATAGTCSSKRHTWQLESVRPALVRVKLIT